MPATAQADSQTVRPANPAGIVFATTLGNALGVTPTVTAVFGVFLAEIAAEFQWPRAEVSGALAAVSVANALATPLAGRMADGFGARRTVLIGSLLLGLSILTLMLAGSNPVLFYLQFIAIGAAGALPASMIYAQIVAERFETRRGLWIGVAGGVGNGLGAALMPLLAGALLSIAGWRGTFSLIALIILTIGLPLQWFLIRDVKPLAGDTTPLAGNTRPAVPLAGNTGAAIPLIPSFEGMEARAALRTPSFWLLLTALPIGGGSLIGLFSMVVPIVVDRGFSLDTATLVVAVFALVCTLWEPTVGFILDRTTRPRILAPFYWTAGGGILLLLYAPSTPLLAASAVMLAIGLGAESSALSFLLSRYFGRRALGTISGIAFAVMLGSGAVMMVLLNAAYDAGAGYRTVVLLLIPVLAWNGAALLLLGRYPFNAETDHAGTCGG